jgi:hypothetical protein
LLLKLRVAPAPPEVKPPRLLLAPLKLRHPPGAAPRLDCVAAPPVKLRAAPPLLKRPTPLLPTNRLELNRLATDRLA